MNFNLTLALVVFCLFGGEGKAANIPAISSVLDGVLQTHAKLEQFPCLAELVARGPVTGLPPVSLYVEDLRAELRRQRKKWRTLVASRAVKYEDAPEWTVQNISKELLRSETIESAKREAFFGEVVFTRQFEKYFVKLINTLFDTLEKKLFRPETDMLDLVVSEMIYFSLDRMANNVKKNPRLFGPYAYKFHWATECLSGAAKRRQWVQHAQEFRYLPVADGQGLWRGESVASIDAPAAKRRIVLMEWAGTPGGNPQRLSRLVPPPREKRVKKPKEKE